MTKKKLSDLATAMKKLAAVTVQQNAELAEAVSDELQALHDAIEAIKAEKSQGGAVIEGYLRVAGSSDPALSYRSYAIQEGVDTDSVFSIFYPCLVGNNLTGNIGVIQHTLKKLGARTATAADTGFTLGQAVWEDLDGQPHAIDGSEGDVFIVNIAPYWQIAGHYDVDGVTLDVFLRSRQAFTFKGIEAEQIDPFGDSPDYCVSHSDNGTQVMHSVYNPSWNGSYQAPYGVTGRYVVTEENGSLVETFDATATVMGGAGGLHTTGLTLYNGEQRAMNMQGGSATVPYFNHHARRAELLWAGIAAEGGTFDAHKASLMGSGFSANDPATTAAHWDESASDARNGVRIQDKDGAWKYYSMASDVKFLTNASDTQYAAYCFNLWRNAWHIMEAYRAVCHAISNSVPELTWFAFEGNTYKWRSITGFDGPAKGEATCVVFKKVATQAGSNAVDPTDKATSIAGNRVELLVSTALWHGITTQVSPSWWTSGLVFTEDDGGNYEAFMQRDQSLLVKTPTGEIDSTSTFAFEDSYTHVGATMTNGGGYARNYHNDALMLPDTNANKTGAGLHTYVGKYNNFTGTAASSGKRLVRGFRRGDYAYVTVLSPLCVIAGNAPSYASSAVAFGTCVRIVTET